MKALRKKIINNNLIIEYEDNGFNIVESHPIEEGEIRLSQREMHDKPFEQVCKQFRNEAKRERTGLCQCCKQKQGNYSIIKRMFLCYDCFTIEVIECS